MRWVGGPRNLGCSPSCVDPAEVSGASAMGRLTLVTGGAASGKSTHALQLASRCGERILFVATCVPRDDEMRAKVARHRAQRPASWTTVEATGQWRTGQWALTFHADFDGAVV